MKYGGIGWDREACRSTFDIHEERLYALPAASSLDERGRILDHASFHDLAYGEWSRERSDRILALDDFMTGAGFQSRLSTDIEHDM
jgi:ketopantoate reductase